MEIETIEREWSRRRSDWAVIVGLFALLTFSPCEAFLPVFLIGSKYGWLGFAFLSAVLATATVGGMVTFTWLTLLGSQRLHFRGTGQIRGDDCRRDFLPARCSDNLV